MTSREKIDAALDRREAPVGYDQSSRSSAIEYSAYNDLKKYLGMDTPTTCFLRAHAELEQPVMDRLGVDTRFLHAFPEYCWIQEPGGDHIFVDAWNVPWRRRTGSEYYELDKTPLSAMTHAEILSMSWDPLVDQRQSAILAAEGQWWHEHTEYALFCDQIGAGVFERAWYLRGYEQFFIEIIQEKAFAHRFLEKILEHQIEGYRKVIEAAGPWIKGVLLTDDLASQSSLLISPDLYREMVYPYHKKLLAFLASENMRVVFHSCGAVYDLLPDLISAGVRILHPVQVSAENMDLQKIKQQYGSDIVLWGGGCDTALLQNGTPRAVRESVLSNLKILAPGGGYVFTTTHCIQPGTPGENIIAMSEALREFNGSV
jgi:uroporphyrinogen decarboxylase